MKEQRDAYDLLMDCCELNGLKEPEVLSATIEISMSILLRNKKTVKDMNEILQSWLEAYKENYERIYGPEVYEKI